MFFLTEGVSFPKLENTHPYNYGQKRTITYSNSSLKLRIVRKYVIELIPVKSYKKSLIFLMVKTLKDIRNHCRKLAKVFHNSLSNLKSMLHFIPMLSSILELSRLVRNLLPP